MEVIFRMLNIQHIILASNNQYKIKEFQSIFDDMGIDVNVIPANIEIPEEVEHFDTYAENARAKAIYVYEQLKPDTNTLVLAEDSGFEVAGLNGFPGLHAKRWLGIENPLENQGLPLAIGIVNKLKKAGIVSRNDRRAKYIAYLVAIYNRDIFESVGELYGYVIDKPRGTYGWAYDKIFIVDSADPRIMQIPNENVRNQLINEELTLAEIEPRYKNILSHRRRAIEELVNKILFLQPS